MVQLTLKPNTAAGTRDACIEVDIASFMSDDSMSLSDVVEQYFAAGFSKEDVGAILPGFQRALEAERSNNLSIAAAKHYEQSVQPFAPAPFKDAGKRVVAANSRENQ